jgi:alkylated DNA repair dioxygenase AlkB
MKRSRSSAADEGLQGDLFGTPGPAGLTRGADLLDEAEEAALLAAIGALELRAFRFHGWTGLRETAAFGWSYDFESGRVAPAPPMPGWLRCVRDRLADAAGLPARRLVQAVVTRYGPGAGIGWHRDRPAFGVVAGLSLGAPATMRLRRRTAGGFARASFALAPRGWYVLDGPARHAWQHGIAPQKETRWSITLRTLADGGRRI